MRVGIEATLLCERERTGLGVYVDRLARALAGAAPADMEFVLLHVAPAWTGGDYGPRCRPVSYRCGPSQFVAIVARLNAVLRRERIDVFHAPANTGLPPWPAVPTVVTLHDLFPLTRPDARWWPGLKRRLLARALYGWALRGATRIICNSRYTQEEAVRHGVARERTEVVYPASGLNLAAGAGGAAIAAAGGTEGGAGPYFLCVGALEPRKGQVELARAYLAALSARPDLPGLVFIGPDRGDGPAMRELCALSPRLRWRGYVAAAELVVAYRHAACFLFPSRDEGFGIPVVEARAAGLPIICADIPVLREVAGGGARFVSPGGWETALREWDSPAPAGGAAPEFTWAEAARRTAAAYRAATGGGIKG